MIVNIYLVPIKFQADIILFNSCPHGWSRYCYFLLGRWRGTLGKLRTLQRTKWAGSDAYCMTRICSFKKWKCGFRRMWRKTKSENLVTGQINTKANKWNKTQRPINDYCVRFPAREVGTFPELMLWWGNRTMYQRRSHIPSTFLMIFVFCFICYEMSHRQ